MKCTIEFADPLGFRAHWRDEAERIGADGLHRALQARDPVMAARLRPSDPQRLVRALEVIDATGVSLAEWQGADAAAVLHPEGLLRIVIAPEREPLYAAIDARFDRMIEQGAIEEVRALLALGLDPGSPGDAGAWRARAWPPISRATAASKTAVDKVEDRVAAATPSGR